MQYLIDAAFGLSWRPLVYDPLGRLFQVSGPAPGGGSTVRRFLYDGDALVAEYDGANQMAKRHVHWPGADLPMVTYEGAGLGTIRQLLADHQGSIVASADASGAAVQINRYDEYGIPGAANGGTFQYTGQMWLSELGMYHYKARIYSPTLGRFLQTDPIGYTGGRNLYAYVGDDPINATDPTGTHGRGTGFTDREWRTYNSAQRAEARNAERAASRLSHAAGQLARGERPDRASRGTIRAFESATGRGNGTAANLSAAAQAFTASAAGLRDDGSNGYVANGNTAAQFVADGYRADTLAHGAVGGRTITANVGHAFFTDSSRLGWAIGHDSLHNAGLRDQRYNGVTAYRFGSDAQRAAWRDIRQNDPGAAMRNPDNLLDFEQ